MKESLFIANNCERIIVECELTKCISNPYHFHRKHEQKLIHKYASDIENNAKSCVVYKLVFSGCGSDTERQEKKNRHTTFRTFIGDNLLRVYINLRKSTYIKTTYEQTDKEVSFSHKIGKS